MLSHLIYYSEYREISLYIFENLKRKSGMETSGSRHRFLVARSDSVREPQERRITSQVSNPHPTANSWSKGWAIGESLIWQIKTYPFRNYPPVLLLGCPYFPRVGLSILRYSVEKHVIKSSYAWCILFFCITKLEWLSFSMCES